MRPILGIALLVLIAGSGCVLRRDLSNDPRFSRFFDRDYDLDVDVDVNRSRGRLLADNWGQSEPVAVLPEGTAFRLRGVEYAEPWMGGPVIHFEFGHADPEFDKPIEAHTSWLLLRDPITFSDGNFRNPPTPEGFDAEALIAEFSDNPHDWLEARR